MVLVSIIMGLGIATLLRGVVGSLRPDTTTAPGLVHAIWVLWVFVMHVGVWSRTLGSRGSPGMDALGFAELSPRPDPLVRTC